MTFEEKYPAHAPILQVRRDQPAWPYDTWRVVADANEPIPQWVYLTGPYHTEDMALDAAEAAFNRSQAALKVVAEGETK